MIILYYIKDWLMNSSVKLPDFYFLRNWHNPDLSNFTFKINLVILYIKYIHSQIMKIICVKGLQEYIIFNFCIVYLLCNMILLNCFLPLNYFIINSV